MKRELKPMHILNHGVATLAWVIPALISASMSATALAGATSTFTKLRPAGPPMDEIREQMCTEVVEPLAETKSAKNTKSDKEPAKTTSATYAVEDFQKISPYPLDPQNPNKIIENTPEEKLYLSRLILQYKMLWNSYFVRNESQWPAKGARRRIVTLRMAFSREPCLTAEHSVAYVKAFIRFQSEDLLWLLDREIASSTSPERAQANRTFITDSLYKQLEKPTLHRLSKKAFNRESAKMVAVPLNDPPSDPQSGLQSGTTTNENGQTTRTTVFPSSNGQPSYIIIQNNPTSR